MKTAIVHYWLLNHRGGEKVVEALCRLLPDADLFTLFYEPTRVSTVIQSRRVTASYLNPFRRWYRELLPLMPLALESFDLRAYDLVISSESGPAKGVITSSATRHLCYCHTPMRYLWDLYPDYLKEWSGGPIRKALMAPCAHYLRLWDYSTAARVDEFIANSENVRRRIWKTYRREARVIYPPVAVDRFCPKEPEDYYLIVSELVAYKRVDTAVRAFSRNGRRLRVVGRGPEYRSLQRQASKNIEFCGHVGDDELIDLYSRCRAFILPGEEDFGMTAVEALASGKPVIALRAGGALETVPPGGGVFYDAPSEPLLEAAIRRLDGMQIDPDVLRRAVAKFSESEFISGMNRLIQEQGPIVDNRTSS
jgi:glycosyltransferase involved in cell wall biosynthesis